MPTHSVNSRADVLRGIAATALAALLAGGVSLVGASAATAAPAGGWTRIAHLSPDTKSVDVRLTGLSGGGVLYELDNVSYGQISNYLSMPAGTYVVSMVLAGADAASTPVVSQSVTVAAGEPITVAAYGTNADLKTAVYTDDLATPASGEARVRVIQASTVAKSVNIKTSTGMPIAEGAQQGAATGYATVPAGPWMLDLTGDGKGSANIDLTGGTVNTLLVLDTADHGLAVKAVVDAAAPATTPASGIDTGGGWAATSGATRSASTAERTPALAAGLGGALLAGVAALVIVRRRGAGGAGAARAATALEGTGRR